MYYIKQKPGNDYLADGDFLLKLRRTDRDEIVTMSVEDAYNLQISLGNEKLQGFVGTQNVSPNAEFALIYIKPHAL